MQNQKDDIGVSIICLTYNHGSYIAKCLSGFVSQKTTFRFQVFVHDDASTDNTAEIINDFASNYPNIIIPLIEKENQYSKNISVIKDILPLAKGKYIAHCEGDDFWSSEYKLQKQYDAMERHKSSSLCVHKVQCVNIEGKLLKEQYPGFMLKTGEITSEQFFNMYSKHNYLFQTSSYLIKSDIYKNYINYPPSFRKNCKVGDIPLLCYCASKGSLYYISDAMSCYRVMSLGSWSSRNSNYNARVMSNLNLIDFDNAFNEYTNFVYNDYMQLSVKRRKLSIAQCKYDYKLCMANELKDAYNILPLRIKLSIYLRCYFPIISKLLIFSRRYFKRIFALQLKI